MYCIFSRERTSNIETLRWNEGLTFLKDLNILFVLKENEREYIYHVLEINNFYQNQCISSLLMYYSLIIG